jgi:microcystin-dependent protein
MDMYIASTDPVDPDGITRWLVCDGRPISRVTYVTLFDLIGTEYGSGDGSTTFNIPDFRQRFPLGMKQPTGQAIRAGQTSTNSAALGEAADIVGSGAMDHAHGIPALSIPTFHVLIPANPIPDHYHTLDGNGGACVEHALGVASGMPPLVIDTQACGFAGGFTADHELDYSAAAGSGLTQIVANTTGGHQGVALYGHTADVIGAPEMPSQDVPVSGLFANNGVSGAANGPYLTVNFKIKVL